MIRYAPSNNLDLATLREQLRKLLENTGASWVRIAYSGGDCITMDAMSLIRMDGSAPQDLPIDNPANGHAVEKAMEFMAKVVEQVAGENWMVCDDNNRGGYGSLRLSLETGHVVVNHHQQVVRDEETMEIIAPNGVPKEACPEFPARRLPHHRGG